MSSAQPQNEFDFLMPPGANPLVTPDACARSLGRKISFVYDMISEGRLEAHAPQKRIKQRYMVTRRSLALLLAETALYTGPDFERRVESLLRTLSAAQLTAVIVTATKRRASL